MTHHIDAAAGTDNMVCFKAIEEARALEADEKGETYPPKGFGAFTFKRIKTQLLKRDGAEARLKDGLGEPSASQQAGRGRPRLRKRFAAIPKPVNLVTVSEGMAK